VDAAMLEYFVLNSSSVFHITLLFLSNPRRTKVSFTQHFLTGHRYGIEMSTADSYRVRGDPKANTALNADASAVSHSNISKGLQFELRSVLLFLIGFRLLNALTIQTFFQPDEYFQALEIAWRLAFGGRAGAWITWVC
jgi:hypothetical protein